MNPISELGKSTYSDRFQVRGPDDLERDRKNSLAAARQFDLDTKGYHIGTRIIGSHSSDSSDYSKNVFHPGTGTSGHCSRVSMDSRSSPVDRLRQIIALCSPQTPNGYDDRKIKDITTQLTIEGRINCLWKCLTFERLTPHQAYLGPIIQKIETDEMLQPLVDSIDCLTIHSLNKLIKSAGTMNRFDIARQAFSAANDKGLADKVTYCTFIDVAERIGHYSEAERAFREAKSKDLADKLTYAKFIQAASKNGHFEQAKEAFREAERRNLVDTYVYSAYIDAAGKNENVAEAKYAFELAEAKSLADVVVYASFIAAMSGSENFQAAKEAFEKARWDDKTNTITYNSFIHAAGKARQFMMAKAAFQEAKDRRLATSVTYSTYINSAAGNEQFSEADSAFKEAKSKGLASGGVYTSYIYAAGRAGKFRHASDAFEEAKSRRLVDAPMVRCYICVDLLCNEARGLEAIIADLRNHNLSFDLHMATSIVDYFVRKGELDKAKDYFKSLPLLSVILQRPRNLLDLHDYSHSMAYILFALVLEQWQPDSMTLITGVGNHPTHAPYAMKNFIIDKIRQLHPDFEATRDPNNHGRLMINRKTSPSSQRGVQIATKIA